LGLIRVRIPARARDNDLAEFPIEGCPLKPDADSMMLNGVAAWAAAMTKQGTVRRRLRGLERLVALAVTGCFRTTSTCVALALANLLPAKMAAGKVLVQQYCPGPLSRRLETIRIPCKWSPDLWHVRQLMLSAGVTFRTTRPAPQVGSPWGAGHRGKLDGERSTEACVWGAPSRMGPSRMKGVGAAFVAVDEQGRVLAMGLFRLPPWATIFQAEAVAQRAALEWCQDLQQEGRWIVASDCTSVLCCPMC